jgi:hypothetical protein
LLSKLPQRKRRVTVVAEFLLPINTFQLLLDRVAEEEQRTLCNMGRILIMEALVAREKNPVNVYPCPSK